MELENRLNEILEPKRLVNISKNRLYTHTPMKELLELERIASEQFDWDQNTLRGRAMVCSYLFKAVICN